MAQFYKELKELRLSKEISLEELETRTKINIKYLTAIEEGNFENITQQFINKQKKHFVIDPQKEIENNKKKNKL